jgi:hypothetical protein
MICNLHYLVLTFIAKKCLILTSQKTLRCYKLKISQIVIDVSLHRCRSVIVFNTRKYDVLHAYTCGDHEVM